MVRQILYAFGILIFFNIISLTMSCSSTSKLYPPATSNHHSDTLKMPDIFIPKSDIVLSFEISKNSIVDTFENILDTVFSQPINFPEQKLNAQLTRLEHAQIEIQGKEILVNLPLLVKIEKETLFGPIYAYGKINLVFISNIEINEHWNLNTLTKLEDYEWIEKPKLNFGFITIPIKWLSEEFISRIKNLVEENIDKSIKESSQLPEQIKNISTILFKPYQLDSTAGGWIFMTADSVHLSPIINSEFYTIGNLFIPVNMMATSTLPEKPDEIILPPFSWYDDVRDTTKFSLWVDLAYEYLTNLSKGRFLQKSFSSEGKTITVEDLQISGDKNRIFVSSQVSGSFNGSIVIAGAPIYKDGILSATDLDWEVKTNNIFHKAATWLGKGYIHDQLNNMLVFDMLSYIERAKEEINQKFLELKENQNVTIEMEWGQFNLSQLHTRNDRLQGLMEMDMKVHVIIDDLKKLKNP